ncbi:hypothetical protein ACH518_02035 [Methylomonas sp. HW2-6]|uniref:hypothetical protein n=1 Tax=Methylomonas sp. HW2-6 TaxID=3376687 RepID=UPI004041BD9B
MEDRVRAVRSSMACWVQNWLSLMLIIGQKQTTGFAFGGQLLNAYQSFSLAIRYEGYLQNFQSGNAKDKPMKMTLTLLP